MVVRGTNDIGNYLRKLSNCTFSKIKRVWVVYARERDFVFFAFFTSLCLRSNHPDAVYSEVAPLLRWTVPSSPEEGISRLPCLVFSGRRLRQATTWSWRHAWTGANVMLELCWSQFRSWDHVTAATEAHFVRFCPDSPAFWNVKNIFPIFCIIFFWFDLDCEHLRSHGFA